MTKKISLYALFTAVAMIFSFIESLYSFSLIPGIKLGLANSAVLLLLYYGDIKGGILVNISRILLTTLLFSNPFSLLYSLSGAAVSMLFVIFLRKSRFLSVVGCSVISAAVHNLTQITVAVLCFSTKEIFFYLPVLMVSGAVTGFAVGVFSAFFEKKCGKTIKNMIQ